MTEFPGIVGPVETVSRLTHASLNNVAVVLRNGEFKDLVEPGKRFTRGFRAPITGNLQVIQVNTGTFAANVTLTELHCEDVLALERLVVKVQVQLNPEHRFAGLRNLVRQYGATFGGALRAELQAALEAHVMGSIRNRTSDELFEGQLANHLGASRLPLRIGGDPAALLMTHLTVEEVTWHQGIERKRRVDAEQMGIAAATQVEMAEQYKQAAVRAARFEAFQPLAAATGVPVELLADPDMRQLERERWQVVMQLLEPGNRAALHRHPGLLDSAMAFLQRNPDAARLHGSTSRALADDDTRELGVLSAGGDRRDGADRPDPAASIAELTVDRKLARVWERLAGPGPQPAGIAAGEAGGRACVVVVADGAGSVEAAPARDIFGRLLGADEVSVLVVPVAPVADLVGGILAESHASAAGCDVRVEVTDRDGLEELAVLLSSADSSARETVTALNDPDDPVVPALEDLLPYAAVSVRLDAATR